MSDDTAAGALASELSEWVRDQAFRIIVDGYADSTKGAADILAALDRAGWALVRKQATVETAATANASVLMCPDLLYRSAAAVTPSAGKAESAPTWRGEKRENG